MMGNSAFKDRAFYVVGMARTGRAAVEFLCDAEARTYIWDDNVAALTGLPDNAHIASPQDLANEGIYDKLSGVLLSPGIDDSHSASLLAAEHDVPLVSDISIFAVAFANSRPIAITGTNGKSTVCLLISHILNHCGIQARSAGNIGEPILSGGLSSEGLGSEAHVLELSSYQIERLSVPRGFADSLQLRVAVLLNIAEDHLDRHGDMRNYARIKASLFDYLADDGAGLAVIGLDDDYCRSIYADLQGKLKGKVEVVAISGHDEVVGGIGVRDGWLYDGMADRAVIDLATLPQLTGSHNIQNLAAAYAALRAYDLPLESICEGMRSFTPLPYRQQDLGACGNLRFINDSKATNVAATAPALLAYDNIYWLAGGQLKDEDFTSLYRYSSRIRKGYFFGRDKAILHAAFADNIACESFDTMAQAFQQACTDAELSGGSGVILLSPMAASFDQFKDFVNRGKAFTDLTQQFINQRQYQQ